MGFTEALAEAEDRQYDQIDGDGVPLLPRPPSRTTF